MPIDYKTIGKRIRKQRRKKNITQSELAEGLDVSVAYMSRIERGSSAPNLERMLQISEILKSPLEYFITGVSSKGKDYLGNEFNEVLENCDFKRKKAILEVAQIIAKID